MPWRQRGLGRWCALVLGGCAAFCGLNLALAQPTAPAAALVKVQVPVPAPASQSPRTETPVATPLARSAAAVRRARHRAPAPELAAATQADGAESAAAARSPGSSQKDTSPRQRAEALYARALQQLQETRGSDARESLQEALILWPGLEDARLLWAALLIEDRQLGRAETLLHDGLGAQTGAPLVLTLARLKVERGEEAAALALLQAHDAVATQDADFQALAAALYLRAGQPEQATERYRRALTLGPGQSAWWAGLGLAQSAQTGQQAQALRSLRHALSLSGLSPSLRDRLLLRVAELQRAEAQP